MQLQIQEIKQHSITEAPAILVIDEILHVQSCADRKEEDLSTQLSGIEHPFSQISIALDSNNKLLICKAFMMYLMSRIDILGEFNSDIKNDFYFLLLNPDKIKQFTKTNPYRLRTAADLARGIQYVRDVLQKDFSHFRSELKKIFALLEKASIEEQNRVFDLQNAGRDLEVTGYSFAFAIRRPFSNLYEFVDLVEFGAAWIEKTKSGFKANYQEERGKTQKELIEFKKLPESPKNSAEIEKLKKQLNQSSKDRIGAMIKEETKKIISNSEVTHEVDVVYGNITQFAAQIMTCRSTDDQHKDLKANFPDTLEKQTTINSGLTNSIQAIAMHLVFKGASSLAYHAIKHALPENSNTRLEDQVEEYFNTARKAIQEVCNAYINLNNNIQEEMNNFEIKIRPNQFNNKHRIIDFVCKKENMKCQVITLLSDDGEMKILTLLR